MRANPYLECPRCELDTLEVYGTDVTDAGIGLRRYRCQECRNTFSTVEAFFTDDEGEEDCFLQLAENVRIRDRETHQRRTGKPPRRQLKPTDALRVERSDGRITISYVRRPKVKSIYLLCKRGHELRDENVGINSTTKNRFCMQCKRDYQRDWQRRKFGYKPEVA